MSEKPTANKSLASLRQSIDNIDTEIIMCLARRIELVKEIGKIKAEEKLPIVQPNRWKSLLQSRLDLATKHGLPAQFTQKIFDLISEYSVSVQEQISRKKDPDHE